MVSIPSLTALRILQGVEFDLAQANKRLASGLRVESAKDDPVAWRSATQLRSEVKSHAATLGMLENARYVFEAGSAGLASTRDSLDKMKSLLNLARHEGADLRALQSELDALNSDLRSIAASSVRYGSNLLAADTSAADHSSRQTLVTSVATGPSGTLSIDRMEIDTSFTRLIDSGTAQSGILQRDFALPDITVTRSLPGLSGEATGTSGVTVHAPSLSGISRPATATDGMDAVAPGTAGLSGTTSNVDGSAGRAPAMDGLDGASMNAVRGIAPVAARGARAVVGTFSPTSSGLRSGDTIELQTSFNDVSRTARLHLRAVRDAASLEAELQRALDVAYGSDQLAAEVASDGTIIVRSTTDGPGNIAVTGVRVVDGDDVTTTTLALRSQSDYSYEQKSINGATHRYDSLERFDLAGIDTSDRLRFHYRVMLADGRGYNHTIAVRLAGVTDGASLAAAINAELVAAGENYANYVGAAFDGTNILFYQKHSDYAINVSRIEAVNGDGVAASNIGFATGSGSNAPATDATAASITTGSDFKDPITLPAGSSLEFDLSINGRAERIAISRATVDAALTGRSGYVPGSGEISGVTNLALVAARALEERGLRNVSVAATGARLTFTMTGTPADGDRLDVGGFLARSGDDIAASVVTGSDFGGPITIASNASLDFTLSIDGAARSINLLAQDVETALSGQPGYRSGTIGSAEQLALVVRAAMDRQSVVGIDVTASGARLRFAKTSAGSGTLALSGVEGKAVATTARSVIDIAAPLTLDEAAKVTWTFTVDGAPRTVEFDKAMVDAALTGRPDYADGSGTIGNAAQLALVLGEAFSIEGIADLVVSATGSRLIIEKTSAGAGRILVGIPSVTVPPSTKASARTGTDFTQPFTLGANERVRFDIALDDAAPTTVVFDRATVDAALAGQGGYVDGSGTIGSVDDLRRVVERALARSGLAGIDVGTSDNRLTFSKTLPGDGRIGFGHVELTGGRSAPTGVRLDAIDLTAPDFALLDSSQRDQMLDAMIAGVEARTRDVMAAEVYLGSATRRFAIQEAFLSNLKAIMTRQIGRLVDADIETEAARQMALLVRRDLAVQALQISNQTQRNILRLFAS